MTLRQSYSQLIIHEQQAIMFIKLLTSTYIMFDDDVSVCHIANY